MLKQACYSLIITSLVCLQVPAQNNPASPAKPAAAAKKKPEFDDSILQAMDHGPFYFGSIHGSTNVNRPENNIALKGVALKLAGGNAGMSFDTELLRMADGWRGGYLTIEGERTTGGHPRRDGEYVFSTAPGPGWAKGGIFQDPRPVPVENPRGRPIGPLPRDWAKFKGLYRHGEKTILSYTVGTSEVLEFPWVEEKEGLQLFTRTLRVNSSSEPMLMLICEDPRAVGYVGAPDKMATSYQIALAQGNVAVMTVPRSEGPPTDGIAVGVVGAPKGSTLEIGLRGRVQLRLPSMAKATTFQVVIFNGKKSVMPALAKVVKARPQFPDLKQMCNPGPKMWGEALKVQGSLGTGTGPYVVDTITVPEENPYKSWIRCSGVDFFSDGRAAVSSLSGDVWLVSGLNSKLDNVQWKRFATGLYQPLGLRIVKDLVYVTCRDQIVRLHDFNRDGEADYYESFNNDISITDHYHEFVLDLQTDSAGNFYFAKGGNLGNASLPHHGTLCRVSPDGSRLDIVATGLRAPNGLGVGPNNEISVSDNEGNWVPSSRVNLVKQGGFYGHVFTSHTPEPPTTYDPPLFWLPHTYDVDNSSGGQVWVNSDRWGPLKGHMLHTSYGACLLFHVMHEEIDGVAQGAVFKFPLSFDSGIMRGRFREQDGQLYVCGLNVWQSANRSGANKRGIFQRVRYTGKPLQMPAAFHVKKNGLEITFTDPLDPASAGDTQNYGIEQWNYKWTSNYGSPEFSVQDPDKKGHDTVEIKKAVVGADNKTVFLEIDGLKPVMQMKIKYNINAADGTALKQEIFNTINKVPGE